MVKEIKVVGWSDKAPGETFPEESEFFNSHQEEIQKAIIEDIVEHKYCFGGDAHQYCEYGSPIISYDGKKRLEWYGFRRWGQIMADAWNIIENPKEKYEYMDFYMNTTIPEHLKINMPTCNDYSNDRN